MYLRKRSLLLLLLLIVAIIWFFRWKAIDTAEKHEYNFSLQQLRGVTKLVIWEQGFMLNNLESKSKTYFNLFTTKESVSTTISGKMGFHINLGDSVNTIIKREKDTIIIKAPLQITYVSLDLGSLQQVKEASLDPTLIVDKNEVIKRLDQTALQKYLPGVIANLRQRQLTDQQRHLSKLVGKPVKIIITRMPQVSDWKLPSFIPKLQ
jgi:NADH dehydrogenase/NADH:ubiquinone oxidoreductase subunit G